MAKSKQKKSPAAPRAFTTLAEQMDRIQRQHRLHVASLPVVQPSIKAPTGKPSTRIPPVTAYPQAKVEPVGVVARPTFHTVESSHADANIPPPGGHIKALIESCLNPVTWGRK